MKQESQIGKRFFFKICILSLFVISETFVDSVCIVSETLSYIESQKVFYYIIGICLDFDLKSIDGSPMSFREY